MLEYCKYRNKYRILSNFRKITKIIIDVSHFNRSIFQFTICCYNNKPRRHNESTFLTENVMGRTYLLFHSRFIRYTSRFALCPPGRYAQRKAIPRRNLIKTIKLWKETSAEPSRSPGEKERKDKKRENKSTRLEARIRFSSPTFIFARFPLNPPTLFFTHL